MLSSIILLARPRARADALRMWPESNGGCGSYSMVSWIASACSRPAISLANQRKSIPAETPAAVMILPAFVGLGLRAHNLQYAHFVPVRGSGRTRKLAFGESSQTERLRGFYIAICYFLSRALSSSVMQASRQAAAIARPRGPCFLFNSRCITTPCSIIMIGYATCAALLSSTPARTR